MKVFNIVKNNNTFVCGTRLPLNAVYGKFRLCNGTFMTYYIDDFKPKYGALWFHFWNNKRQEWVDCNTRSNRVYTGFHCYLYEKFQKFQLWDTVCVEYLDRSMLPVRKCAQNSDTMFYKIPNIGYALNKRIMTDDCVSSPRRKYADLC